MNNPGRAPAPPCLPSRTRPWLVADIGGTNARFGWVDDASLEVRHVRKLPAAGHAEPEHAVRAYLAEVQALMGADSHPPARAAFAVATAVGGDVVAFTNSHWRFSRSALQAALGLELALVLNDFEALALSLPSLQPAQLVALGPVLPVPRGTLAVVGPGTGLGVACVKHTRQGWVVVSGEGGHATLAPTDDFESDLLAHARRHYSHVSAERLLSGIGLPALHAAVAAVLGVAAEPVTAEQIVERALAGTDAVCGRTVDSFCALLGSFTGSVALTLGARDGVYIGGGIVPRLGARFEASRFRACFEAKGRRTDYMRDIPIALITDTLTALSGAALAIAQHEG